MEKAKVYFSDLRTSPTSNLLDKMERLLKRAGIGQLPLQDSFTAIKIHFGEPGNLAYIRPMPGDYCRRSQRYGLQGNTDRRRILPDSQDRHRYRRCGHHNQHEPL